KRERLQSLLHRLADPRKKLADQRLRLDDLFFRLASIIHRNQSQKTDLFRLKAETLLLLHPGRRVVEYSHRLRQLFRQLTMAQQVAMRLWRQKTQGGVEKLQTLSPLAILARGYSIALLLPAQEIICRASSVKVNDQVQVKVHQGEFIARVEEVQEKQEDQQPSLTLKSRGV
ncbi:MAG: exodeoxyribonuclease VII large subunit, partial [Pseudomonadota bacterium]